MPKNALFLSNNCKSAGGSSCLRRLGALPPAAGGEPRNNPPWRIPGYAPERSTVQNCKSGRTLRIVSGPKCGALEYFFFSFM